MNDEYTVYLWNKWWIYSISIELMINIKYIYKMNDEYLVFLLNDYEYTVFL